MNQELIELKNNILADGKIDADEATQLRTVLFVDGQIDEEEADFLFELNNAVSSNANHESWTQLFVEAITGHLLNDENSPNQIDDSEAEWLLEKLQGDGKIDAAEKALLKEISNRATAMPAPLKAFIQSNI